MASELLTADWAPENFYTAYLSADITDSATDIFLDVVPTQSEGTLVIDPESDTNREIIYYSSKTGTKVVCPGNGRGYDNTTAVSHLTGTKVIMAPVADWFNSLKTLFTTTPQGWSDLGDLPDTVTYNGNRSYDLVFNSNDLTDTVSNGMRLKLTRTVTAPTQCADLESGSSHYFNKTSPAGTTSTDDFCAGAWIKLESYGAAMSIVSRYNGTSGWDLQVTADGTVRFTGFNASASNYSRVTSYQSIPLGRWVHVAAQLDMSAFTATTTTSYIMIDGVNVPASVDRAGTNPTALVQAGNLEVGGRNGGLQPFDGKLAQVWYSSAKITQANIQTLIGQGLTASLISTHSIVSAYSLSNDITDLNTTNANNLSAQNSAVATATDTPFSGGSTGTTEYAIITANAFSTNTTLTVQVPEGYAIPTSGGVSAVSYSTQDVPYGFPRDKGKWRVATLWKTAGTTTSNATFGAFQSGGYKLNVPVGAFRVGQRGTFRNDATTNVCFNVSSTALTGMTNSAGADASPLQVVTQSAAAASSYISADVSVPYQLSAATDFIMYTQGASTSAQLSGTLSNCEIYAEFNYV